MTKGDLLLHDAKRQPDRYNETLAAIIAGILVATKIDWPKVQAAMAQDPSVHGTVVLELAHEAMDQIETWWPTNNPPPTNAPQILVAGADPED